MSSTELKARKCARRARLRRARLAARSKVAQVARHRLRAARGARLARVRVRFRERTFMTERLMELFSSSAIVSGAHHNLRKRILAILAGFFGAKKLAGQAAKVRVARALRRFPRQNVAIRDGTNSLAARFWESTNPEESISVDSYLNYLEQYVVRHSINMASPRCMGHMSSISPNFAAPLNQLVVAINQNLVKRDASKSLTLVERQTAGMLHRMIYNFPASFYDQHIQCDRSTLGIMASGGTLANITALWIARNRCLSAHNGFAGVEKEGMRAALDHYGYDGAVLIGSSLMHYSIEKAATLLGIGERSVIKIPVDAEHRIAVDQLQRAIDRCVARKQCIFALIGVAGTTDAGSIDPLREMAKLARDTDVHFHVDAAWGAPLLFSSLHRGKLAGIEDADSVTADGHKQLYLPIGASMLLLRDPAAAQSIERQTRYMLQRGSGDLGRRSIEGSRPGTALLMHAALHIIGRHGYEALVNENLSIAQQMAASIGKRAEFELLCEPQTNILLYRYVPSRWRDAVASGNLPAAANLRINAFNERLQKAQARAGRTFVSRTTLEKSFGARRHAVVALRAVVSNPFATQKDIEAVLNDQLQIAAKLTEAG